MRRAGAFGVLNGQGESGSRPSAARQARPAVRPSQGSGHACNSRREERESESHCKHHTHTNTTHRQEEDVEKKNESIRTDGRRFDSIRLFLWRYIYIRGPTSTKVKGRAGLAAVV